MLEQLLPQRLASTVIGDGAGDMVQAIGSRDDDGRVAIVVVERHGRRDQGRRRASARSVGDATAWTGWTGIATGCGIAGWTRRTRTWSPPGPSIGAGADWPDEAQWHQLGAEDRLEELEPERVVEAASGSIELAFELPMPSVSLIELTPE